MGFYDSTKDGVPDPEIELDLTTSHLHSLEEVDVKSTLQYVDLTTNRLKELDSRILELQSLKFLCLRQNLFAEVKGLDNAAFKDTLEELYVNDNQLTAIPDLTGFSNFKRLEFSYNQIRSLQPLELIKGEKLVDLYCAVNKISGIASLDHLTNLTALELGSNRIAEIENLDTLVKLDQLWLGRNRITAIRNLAALTCLRQLSLQANRLESMAGVGVLGSLEELYLSQNGITQIEDLTGLTNLTILDLATNAIKRALKSVDRQCVRKVEGLENQTKLTDLWLNNNPIEDLDHIADAVASCKDTLSVVYLEMTPAAKSTDAYLLIMKDMLPSLEYLDHMRIQR